jgi:hypothetical protein
MTNLEAYMAYNPDAAVGTLALGLYDLSVDGTSDNKAAMALGMIDKAISGDYKQGYTSETTSNESRSYLYNQGKAILASVGIIYVEPNIGIVVNGGSW